MNSILATYGLVGETSDRAADVEFSAQNSVVLVIDEGTGSATLENLSPFNIDIDSYLIESPVANVLDPSGWSPLAQSDPEWTNGTGQTNRLFEGNFGDSTPLTSGSSLAIGAAIDASLLDDEEDLLFEFSINGVNEAFVGGVIIVPDPLPADFDGNNTVDGGDLVLWEGDFGVNGDSDSDRDGDSDISDLLLWQIQFGTSIAAPVSAVSVVPEPSTLILFAISCGPLAVSRRRRGMA